MVKTTIGNGSHFAYIKIIKNVPLKNITTNPIKKNTDKILLIDSIESFDIFTEIYGYIDNKEILIKWDSVAKDFKGFKLGYNDELFEYRFYYCYYKNKQYYSWWDSEYYFNDPIIFYQPKIY
ncbi:hypothetical protein QJ857_gp0174 [Tupanvirus soda lake]|uniref:Uncharacterized protein n=2 Tax=Tupanvirus TaxID=2094720 RepID=A0A6N1NPT9_9VIRU|nr:hypothetical protein QJ857_gp0174 [Tupanvirus soda lake]QKU35850.1 hypothetical protein [Tupanvirus soda lake]